MNFKNEDFYEHDSTKLKKEYLLSYSFTPGLYDNIRIINLFIDTNLNYQLFTFFYAQPSNLEEINEDLVKESRTTFEHQSKLPKRIRERITQLFSFSKATLKQSYYNEKNLFGILDRTQKYYQIHYNNVHYSMEMSLDRIDKNLFNTEVDQLFLQLTEAIEAWLEQLIDGFIHTHNEN